MCGGVQEQQFKVQATTLAESMVCKRASGRRRASCSVTSRCLVTLKINRGLLEGQSPSAERRRKLGLPIEVPSASRPNTPSPVEENKSALPIRPATKSERMRHCL